jgi:hypothetical protein
VSRDRHQDIADRKALLMAHAELDRAKVTLAVLGIRSIVSPEHAAERRERMRPRAATVLNLVTPLLGERRVGRMLRFVSIALMALRVARNWR